MKKVKKLSIKTLAFFLSIVIAVVSLPLSAFAMAFDNGQEELESIVTNSSEPVELIYERTADTKRFRMEDGSFVVAQYDTAVHYLDENGGWQDIDNRLTADGSEITTSNAKIKFAKKTNGNGNLFALHDGNRKITLSLNGANKKVEGQITNYETQFGENATPLEKMTTLDHVSASVKYENILQNTDLEYVIDGLNIKENIIVKAKGDGYSYSFTVALNNLRAQKAAGGEIEIVDSSTDEIIYLIPAPIMWDANGVSSDSVEYSLTDLGNGKYDLIVVADSFWMNDNARAYPVIIDPAIYQSTSSGVIDLKISEVSSNSNDEGSSTLYLDSSSYIYWKLNSLPILSTSAVITNAKYQATCYNPSYLQGYIGVYKVLKDWDSGLTHQAMDDARLSENDVPGERSAIYTDFAYISELGTLESPEGVVYYWNVTPMVKNWYNGNNYGLCLGVVSGTTFDGAVQFYTSESTTRCPSLTIEYRDQKGLEDYWSYSTQSIGLAGSSFINHANGNLTLSIPTVSTFDGLMPFTPTLVYNSSMATRDFVYQSESVGYRVDVPYTSATMPTGFKLNLQETLLKRSYMDASGATNFLFTWNDSDGTEHYFIMKSGQTCCVDEDGLHLKLEQKISATDVISYTITDNNKNVRTFFKMPSPNDTEVFTAWYLSGITDINGNMLHFIGNDDTPHIITSLQLETATGETNEQLNFLYNSEGRLYCVFNKISGEYVFFYYTTQETYQQLSKIVRLKYPIPMPQAFIDALYSQNPTLGSSSSSPVIGEENYVYDESGYLVKVRNKLSNYEINYQFLNGKVTSVQEKAGPIDSLTDGQTILLQYETDYTTVQTSGTDDIIETSDDLLTTYLFDYAGRCINSYTTDINRTTLYGASSGEYVNDNENAKNSLKTVSQTTHRSSNYLINGGFENGITNWDPSYVQVVNSGYNNLSSFEGDKHAHFSISGGSGSLSQTLKLDSGQYVLSMYYRYTYAERVPCKATIEIISDLGIIAQEAIPLDVSSESQDSTQMYYYISVPFTVPQSDNRLDYTVKINLSNSWSANAFLDVDNVMLAKSVDGAEYDMLQMGHFESTHTDLTLLSHWSGQTSKASIVTFPTDVDLFGNVLCLNGGRLGTETTIFQTVYEATSEMQTGYSNSDSKYYKPGGTVLYNFSGWAKAVSGSGYGANSTFKARVSVEYYTKNNNGTTEIETEIWDYDFNREITQWQYFNATVPVNTNYRLVNKITVSLHYGNQPNIAYFDELALICNSDQSAAYEYNEAGYVISAASGKNETQYFYNDNNDVLRSLTPNGMLTEYTYDAQGRLSTEVVKYWNGNINACPGIDQIASWSSSSAPILTETRYTYNEYGLLIETVVSDGSGAEIVTQSEYSDDLNLIGIKTADIDARGERTEYFYESTNGRLIAVIYPDKTGMYYQYNNNGSLQSVQPVNYNTTQVSPITTSAQVSYTYDSANRISSIRTRSTIYNFQYDVFGNTTQIKAGSNTLASYSYNENNGKLSTLTYGNGLSVKYLYDSLDRISEIQYNIGKLGWFETVYFYRYTIDGQLAAIEDYIENTVTVFSYDSSGRLIGSYVYHAFENISLNQSHFLYDDSSRLTDIHHAVSYKVKGDDSDGTYLKDADDKIHAQYTYNRAGRLEKVSYKTGDYSGETSLVYDNFGRINQKNIKFTQSSTVFQINSSYTYVNVETQGTTALVESHTSTVKNQQGQTLGSTVYRYTYDENGNITAIRNNLNEVVAEFSYDSLGQLTEEINVPLNRRYVWTYDTAGNILSRTVYNKSTGAQLSKQNYAYSTGSWGDLLTSVGNTEIQYDSIGNPTMWGENSGGIWYDGAILEWQGRQLHSFQAFRELDGDYMDADYAVYFTYNADGIRTEKNTDLGNHEYILNGSQIVGEWIGGRTTLIIYLYDENGAPIGMKIRDYTQAEGEFDEYFFEKNLQGDIVAIYNINGVKIGTYTYDAWGNFTITLASTNTSAENEIVNTYNPFRYRGYYYDVETGLYYLQSRYYNPNWGRFINLDSVIACVDGSIKGYNLFAYCFNNPVNLSDSIGNWPKWIETAANWVNDNIIQPVADFIDKTIDYLTPPSKEEHYNRNQNNIQFPEEYDETFFKDWDDSVSANCHQFSAPDRDNVKYVSPDGRYEAIYDVNNNLVTDPRDVGTYNFVSPNEDAFGHFVKDVIPWIQHGNSPDDSTEWWQRALSFIGIYV